jgi:hypothetical protein
VNRKGWWGPYVGGEAVVGARLGDPWAVCVGGRTLAGLPEDVLGGVVVYTVWVKVGRFGRLGVLFLRDFGHGQVEGVLGGQSRVDVIADGPERVDVGVFHHR